jgi:hypothetical protein
VATTHSARHLLQAQQIGSDEIGKKQRCKKNGSLTKCTQKITLPPVKKKTDRKEKRVKKTTDRNQKP